MGIERVIEWLSILIPLAFLFFGSLEVGRHG